MNALVAAMAIAVFAACAVLPVLGHLRAVMRVRPAAEVRAAAEARHQRVCALFDQLDRTASAGLGGLRAVGALPDRRKTPRKEITR